VADDEVDCLEGGPCFRGGEYVPRKVMRALTGGSEDERTRARGVGVAKAVRYRS